VLLIFLLALAGLAVHTAWADPGEYKNYGRVGVGVNQFSADLDDAGFDAGITSNATCGRYLAKNLVFEATVGYLYTDQDFSGSTSVAGSYTRDDKISVSSILATLKGQIPVGPVTFYGGAGIGVYYAAFSTEIETANLGDFDVDDDDTVLGVHLVVGGCFDITQRFFIDAEGLYRRTGDLNINKTTGTVPVQLKGDLDGFAVTVSAGYRF
jgi:opacity protein-like surface antigen